MFLKSSLILFFLVACQGIKFDPNPYVSDYKNRGIVNRDGDFVSCAEPRFNDYACLSVEKLKELAEILKRARLPRKEKNQKLKELDELIKTLD